MLGSIMKKQFYSALVFTRLCRVFLNSKSSPPWTYQLMCGSNEPAQKIITRNVVPNEPKNCNFSPLTLCLTVPPQRELERWPIEWCDCHIRTDLQCILTSIYTGWGTVTCWFKFGAKRLEVVGERWGWYHCKRDIPKFRLSLD